MRHIKRIAYQEFRISFAFITDKDDDKLIDSYLGNVFFLSESSFHRQVKVPRITIDI